MKFKHVQREGICFRINLQAKLLSKGFSIVALNNKTPSMINSIIRNSFIAAKQLSVITSKKLTPGSVSIVLSSSLCLGRILKEPKLFEF